LPGKRNNRAALREYYNLKKAPTSVPQLEISDAALAGGGLDDQGSTSPSLMTEPSPLSELDSSSLDINEYISRAASTLSLAELLAMYTRVLGEMRALDAERKALVYDNYSKLISATETIRKMRATMDPLGPVVAGTLAPAVERIYEQATEMRDRARGRVEKPRQESKDDGEQDSSRSAARTRELALMVLATPARLRKLVEEGKIEEARQTWEMPRRLLEKWKERGIGGDDVDACLEEGDAAIREDDSSDESGDAP
jgi:hypothetical protein